MESTAVVTIFLQAALAVIMLGLGLGLTVDDFRRVARYPRAVAVGLACQMLILPVVCFGVATAFALPGPLAVGLMLLAASPGGVTANLFSHLAKGDVALNITLTAVNSVLSLLTLPIIVNLAMAHFMGEGRTIPLQLAKVVQVFAVVLIPVVIGMAVRSRWPRAADRLARPVKIVSAVFLVLVVIGAVVREWRLLVEHAGQIGLAALAFNVASMAVGYLVPRLARVNRSQAIAVGMEIGIHNGTLAIAIASSPNLLNDTTMAMPAAVYSFIMFFTAALFGFLVTRRADTPD